jgi:iron complex outermembrane receptor protein
MQPISRLPLCAAISCCLAFCFIPHSRAAEADADADIYTLDTLLVTAIKPSSSLVWVTNPKLPRQPVPASDGADYLKTIPGFSAIRNGGTNGDPVLRGMFGSRLNVHSNDGIMIGACPSRMDNSLSYIAPETYDRLTIIKGPQTVQWGPGASAGTVRFERDTPHFEQATLQGQASALVGSHNRNDQVLDLTAGNTLGYIRATGNRSEADDYEDGDGATVASRWRKWNSDVAVGWTPDADTVLEVSAGTGDALARYAARSMDGSQFRRTSYGARFEKTNLPGAWQSVKASVYYNNADHVMDNYSLRTPKMMAMVSNLDRRTTGGRMAVDWRWSDVLVVAGIDAQDSRHRHRGGNVRGGHLGKPWTEDARMRNLGAFSELTLGADTASRWISGLRIDRAEAEDKRATSISRGQTRKEDLGSGFLRYEHDMGADLTWYAGIGRSSRMPDYWELFVSDPTSGVGSAFSSIDPERTTQLDIGMQYRGARIDAWVSAYAGYIEDYILFNYTTNAQNSTTKRVGNIDAGIAGSEAGVEWRPADGWKLGGTLAYAWGENRSDGGALPQMPPLESKFSVDWQGQRWSAGALLRAVSQQSRVAAGMGNVVGRDLGPSAGFATLALSAGYRFADSLRATAGIDNVFDRTYSEHLNLSGNVDYSF